jgi:hypothetical protein
MKELKFLVYDPTNGYARLLKHHFSNDFDFQIWKGNGKDVLDTKKRHVAFINIHSYSDLIEALLIYQNSEFIFWTTSIWEVKETLNNIENFFFIDMELNKRSLVTLLRKKILTI